MHWLDSAYLLLSRRLRLFHRGWGDLEPVMQAAAPLLNPHPPAPLELAWQQKGRGLALGSAPSPCPFLPGASAALQVLKLSPEKVRARLVLPPAWGEEGFMQRRFGFTALLREGVELWLLEGAFFGSRRDGGPPHLATVRDFLLMGLANVLETRALVGAARADGTPVAVAGYSMAGQLGAQAVATLPWDVPVVAMAPSDTASAVFLDGPLSKTVAFGSLGLDARARLQELFDRARLQVLPPPRSPKRVVVGTRLDGIVPPEAMERVAQHWSVKPRWVESGHLGGYVLHRKVLQRAVMDVIG